MKKNRPGKKKKWSKKEISELELIKDSNYDLESLACKYRTNVQTVDFKINKMRKIKPWSEEEDLIIKNNYGYNPNILSLLPERTMTAIHLRASKFKIKKECGNYKVNHLFFDKWNEDVAYIVGFMIADGCVEPKYNRFTINLSSVDIEFLYDIRAKIGSTNPIYKKKRGDVSLTVHNRKMVNDLMSKGVIPNKTNRTRLPDCPAFLKPHLIRGILDGDGSIYFDNQYKRIQFLGSKNLLNEIAHYFNEILDIDIKIPKQHGKSNTMKISYKKRSDVEKICTFLYPNDNILSLKRKMVSAREVTPRQTNLAQIRQVQPSWLEEPERKDIASPMRAETTCETPSKTKDEGIVQT